MLTINWLSNASDFRNTIHGNRQILFSVCGATILVSQNNPTDGSAFPADCADANKMSLP